MALDPGRRVGLITGDDSGILQFLDRNVVSGRMSAQTFRPSSSLTVSKVKVKLVTQGSTFGTWKVSIQRTTATGRPDMTDLASGTVSVGAALPLTGEWFEITLTTPITLKPGVRYALVGECNAPSAANTTGWRFDADGSVEGGSRWASTTGGVGWDAGAGALMFQIDDALAPTRTLYPDDAMVMT